MSTKNAAWYTLRKITTNIWSISEQGWDMAYLVLGKTRALLIDTTFGIDNLRAVATSLTKLPLTVVLTHGHGDHASGSCWFDKVHIIGDDVKLLKSNFIKKSRNDLANNFSKLLRANGISPKEWAKASPKEIITIKDGHIFDIGDMAFRVISVPGHTKGCICLFEERKGFLFTGDSVLEGEIYLHSPDSTDLKTYLASLKKLRDQTEGVKWILPAHNKTPLDPSLISGLIRGTEGILSGKRKGRPFTKDNGLKVRIGKSILVYK